MAFETAGEGPASGPVKTGLIGDLLVARGATTPLRIDEALAAQRLSAARLGRIVVARGWASARAVAEAAAAQIGARAAPAALDPLDPALGTAAEAPVYLRRRIAPWRREGARVVWLAADHAEAAEGLRELGRAPETSDIALADGAEIAAAVAQAWPGALSERAATRAPLPLSARARGAQAQRAALGAGLAALLAAAFAWPAAVGLALFLALAALNALNAGFRIAVLHRALRPLRDPLPPEPEGALKLADRRPPPRITLLIPLLREPECVPALFEALRALDWPAELLDVKLILETGDAATRLAIDTLGPPPFCEVLTVPPGGPRTKPRALNYALDFAEGEIVGVYDAEDRPEPDQLRRVAAILRESPPEVACVQCRLDYYNAADGWLTRCFAIEYAIWFDVLLAGFRDLRLPIPLGGTSVFFRRAALERLGGWDAHNVTEDADLGMRLARAGMRCEIGASRTREEAACRPAQWLRQRSRWLKGYMTTWLVHMRRPRTLRRELGLRGFVAFHAIFLGAAAAYLGLPLLWLVWGATALGHGPAWLAGMPGWAFAALTATQLAGWGAMIVAAFVATARRGEGWLWPWIPTLVFYWPMGAAAAYLAVIELIVAPTFWRKTPHGLDRATVAAAVEARRAAG